jgi:hypothetical protein
VHVCDESDKLTECDAVSSSNIVGQRCDTRRARSRLFSFFLDRLSDSDASAALSRTERFNPGRNPSKIGRDTTFHS